MFKSHTKYYFKTYPKALLATDRMGSFFCSPCRSICW